MLDRNRLLRTKGLTVAGGKPLIVDAPKLLDKANMPTIDALRVLPLPVAKMLAKAKLLSTKTIAVAAGKPPLA
jgi:hypothetical protein